MLLPALQKDEDAQAQQGQQEQERQRQEQQLRQQQEQERQQQEQQRRQQQEQERQQQEQQLRQQQEQERQQQEQQLRQQEQLRPLSDPPQPHAHLHLADESLRPLSMALADSDSDGETETTPDDDFLDVNVAMRNHAKLEARRQSAAATLRARSANSMARPVQPRSATLSSGTTLPTALADVTFPLVEEEDDGPLPVVQSEPGYVNAPPEAPSSSPALPAVEPATSGYVHAPPEVPSSSPALPAVEPATSGYVTAPPDIPSPSPASPTIQPATSGYVNAPAEPEPQAQALSAGSIYDRIEEQAPTPRAALSLPQPGISTTDEMPQPVSSRRSTATSFIDTTPAPLLPGDAATMPPPRSYQETMLDGPNSRVRTVSGTVLAATAAAAPPPVPTTPRPTGASGGPPPVPTSPRPAIGDGGLPPPVPTSPRPTEHAAAPPVPNASRPPGYNHDGPPAPLVSTAPRPNGSLGLHPELVDDTGRPVVQGAARQRSSSTFKDSLLSTLEEKKCRALSAGESCNVSAPQPHMAPAPPVGIMATSKFVLERHFQLQSCALQSAFGR